MARQPQATISHYMTGRVRLRIKEPGPGRIAFFERVQREITEAFASLNVSVRPETGSIVLQGPELDLEKIRAAAQKKGWFEIADNDAPLPKGNLVSYYARQVVGRVDSGLRQLTGERLDMPSSVFAVLVIHAVREIAKGNLRTPSWFTALWFASTLYTRDFSSPRPDGNDNSGGSGDDAHE